MTTTGVTNTSPGTNSVTDEELNVLRATLNPDLTSAELRLFALVAKRSGLDVFARQIYAIKRRGRLTFQTSIDGLRSIAARTGVYDGQDETEYGPWIEKPFGHPEYATVRVFRKGVSRAITATAYFDEYAPESGPSGQGDVMWRRMPRVMLAKVAEALALRKAFPYDPEAGHGIGGDIYSDGEMAQADRPSQPAVAATATARERLAARRAELEARIESSTSTSDIQATDTKDERRPIRDLSRTAFLELVAAAEIGRDAVAAAAADLFPGVASGHYTDAHWGALADQLHLPRDERPEPPDAD